MRKIETTIYTYDELSPEAKEKALEIFREINVDYCDWAEGFETSSTEVLESIGFKNVEMLYEISYSQGGGVCFSGEWVMPKVPPESLPEDFREYYDELVRFQKHYPPFEVDVRTYMRGGGSYVARVDFEEEPEDSISDLEYAFEDILNGICETIYVSLVKEYEYLTSDEVVEETIRLNEYEFTEDGKFYS